jgi:DNA-binding transcriptional LysR family regulator
MGAALMPRLSLHGDGRGTTVVELAPPLPDRVVSLIWHRDRHLSVPARALIAITREVAAGERSRLAPEARSGAAESPPARDALSPLG